MNRVSQVLTHCLHFALPLISIPSSLSLSVFCCGKLLSRSQITLSPLLLPMKTTHLLLYCDIFSVLLKLSSKSSVTRQWNFRFSISRSPFSLLPGWCWVQNHPESFWHTPFSCLKTKMGNIPSRCCHYAESGSHKLRSKVIDRTRRLLSAWVITVPITEPFHCLPVSPSQSSGVTKPFPSDIPPDHRLRVYVTNQPGNSLDRRGSGG